MERLVLRSFMFQRQVGDPAAVVLPLGVGPGDVVSVSRVNATTVEVVAWVMEVVGGE